MIEGKVKEEKAKEGRGRKVGKRKEMEVEGDGKKVEGREGEGEGREGEGRGRKGKE